MSSELDRERQRAAQLEAGIQASQQRHASKNDMDLSQFDWVKLHKELSTDQETGKAYHETSGEKTKRVFGSNPFVPIGK